MSTRRHLLAAAAAAVASPLLAQAPVFPNRPLKLIVPYPPGGATDVLGRAFAQLVGESLGQAVVVENRPGANGALGCQELARSPGDGYSFALAGSSTHVLNPLLYKVAYDPVKDFTPLGMVATTGFVIVVKPDHPQFNFRSLPELLAHARAHPGQLSYGSFGNASAGHLAGEMFKHMAKVDMVHVPYKGSAPAQTDLLGGVLPLMFSDLSAMAHVRAGRMRALAVTGGRRLTLYPDIPTVAEAGVPGYDVQGWFAFYAPAAVPRPVTERLNGAIVRAVETGAMRERLATMGLEPAPGTPDALAAVMRSDTERWTRLIRDAGIKAE
ncbi:MAG TPA: tripartite tricarboxylate transporter substrate binding protein [Ramlibacter sp.]|nr:tripartite tricarboxylate transporter substrate binding protein [Ramlibacter sp.]